MTDLLQHLKTLTIDSFIGDIEFTAFLPWDNIARENNITEQLQQLSLSDVSQSLQAIDKNLQVLKKVLDLNFLSFLKVVKDSKSLRVFLQSYLQYRKRPYEENYQQSNNEKLLETDFLIVALYYRLLVTSKEEYTEAMKQLQSTTNKLQVITNSNKNNPSIPTKTTNQLEQYNKFIQQLDICSFTYLLSIFTIIATATSFNNNNTILAQIIDGLLFHTGNSSCRQAIQTMIQESHIVINEIIQSIIDKYTIYKQRQTLQATTKPTTATTSKKNQLVVINNSTNSKQKQILLQTEEVSSLFDHKLLQFVVDIAYSWLMFMTTLTTIQCQELGFISDNSNELTKHIGALYIQNLQLIYEVIIPFVYINDLITSSSADHTDNAHCINILKTCCLKGIQLLLTKATELISSSSTSSHKKTIQSPEDQTLSFFELFSTKQTTSYEHIVIDICKIGTLLSDYLLLLTSNEKKKIMSSLLSSVLEGNQSSDDEMIDYFIITSFMVSESLLQNPFSSSGTTTGKENASLSVASVASKADASSNTATSAAASNDEVIENIQSIFPELGDGFIEVCLLFYQNNSEELIEALLTDNLHPQLALLSRTTTRKDLQHNKQYTGTTSTNTSSTAAVNHAKNSNSKVDYGEYLDPTNRENQAFFEKQKQLAKQLEAEAEYDAYIVDKEYDDDYDDQYDFVASKPTTQTTEEDFSSKKPATNTSTRLSNQGDWQARMAETRRYNALLKAEEQDAAFWQQMKNTNRSSNTNNQPSWKTAENEDENVVDSDIPTKQAAATTNNTNNNNNSATNNNNSGKDSRGKQNNQNNSTNTNSKNNNNSNNNKRSDANSKTQNNNNNNTNNNNKKQPPKKQDDTSTTTGNDTNTSANNNSNRQRTKMFDKHHQKEAAQRKLAKTGFAPQF